jgi:hypothetical protein
MQIPPQPYINLQTCSIVPAGQSLSPGQTFYWYNPTIGPCTITINGIWCSIPTPNPVPSNAYATSAVANNCPPGSYGWTGSNCCPAAMPIHVSAGLPGSPRKHE